jgi:hypothetical protein
MADFAQDIKNFTNFGIYNYMFDEAGNEVVNPSSSVFQQNYFSLPLTNVVYDNNKVLNFYNPTFLEFVKVPSTSSTSVSLSQDTIDQINTITFHNQQLQSQLDSIVNATTVNSASANIQSIMDTIIGLRIQLGQGITPVDFDTVFPFLPIPVELRDISTA